MSDDRDEKLLSLLEANARMPVAELARAVNLSPTAVRQRLARMERDGDIGGYTIRRPMARHEGQVQVLVTLRLGAGSCRDLLADLEPLPGLKSYWTLAGESDAVMLLQLPDMAALQSLGARLQEHPAVARVTTKVVLETLVSR